MPRQADQVGQGVMIGISSMALAEAEPIKVYHQDQAVDNVSGDDRHFIGDERGSPENNGIHDATPADDVIDAHGHQNQHDSGSDAGNPWLRVENSSLTESPPEPGANTGYQVDQGDEGMEKSKTSTRVAARITARMAQTQPINQVAARLTFAASTGICPAAAASAAPVEFAACRARISLSSS